MNAKLSVNLARSLTLLAVLALILAFPRPGLALDPPCVDPSNTPTCYATIQEAIAAASAGDTISVAVGTFTEIGQIVIDKDLSIVGADNTTTIVKPAGDTDDGSVGDSDARGWFLVSAGNTFNLSNVTLDGTGRTVSQAIRTYGDGTIDNVAVTHMTAPTAGREGTGVAVYGASGQTVNITNSSFDSMGRVGLVTYDAATLVITGSTFSENDFGLEIQSAGGLGSPTVGITGSTFIDNTTAGIAVASGMTASNIAVHASAFSGNTPGVANDGTGVIDATANWWGDASGPGVVGPGAGDTVSVNVDFLPWCGDAACTFYGPTYTLTYTAGANGSITGTTPQTVNHGDDGSPVTAVPASGYTFVNWSDLSTANPRTDSNVTGNITVTANFAINTYTLTYTAVANGSISGTTPQTVNHGDDGSPVTAVPASGYTFVNWSDLSTANPRTDSNVTGNITVTANFAINTYTLTYTAGANGSITGTTPQTVNHGDDGSPVTAVPASGYTFVNWSDLSTANPRTDSNVTGNITVTANFAINTYTLTYTAVANGSISGTTPQTVNHGDDGSPVTAMPATGYHFVNWSDLSTANPRTDTNVQGDITVTASFAINTYTLTYTAGANGSISGTTPQTVNHGASGAAVTAMPATGYHFVNWSDLSTSNPRTDTNVQGNITVTASFAINTYTLTYTAGANGSITGVSPQTVNHGASGTAVTPVPATGYHFVNWSDLSTANPRTDTNVTGNITVTANFAINTYTLTYTAGSNGSITGTTPQTVNHGASGTAVTAVPATGYHFVTWSDSVLTASRTDTNVTANKSVTASFAINTYTLTYTAGANGSISGTTPQTVNHGASGTAVTAVPATGYHFVTWSDSVLTASRTDTNVTANKSVTASFAINTYTLTYTAGANGSISGTTPQTVNHGASGTAVTAVPASGYHFVNWSDSSTANPRTDTNVTANKSVTAFFAIGIDIAYNGGFEEGDLVTPGAYPSGWVPDEWNLPLSTFTWDTGFRHSGDRSVKIQSTTANDARWIQTVSVQPGATYRLSGWISTDNVGHSQGEPQDAGANLSVLDGTINYTTPLFGDNGWIPVSKDFTTGETQTSVIIAARLGMYSGTTVGVAWFDDIKLALLSTPTCYSLTAVASPLAGGSVSTLPIPNCGPGATYAHGTVATLSATPAAGYSFAGWTGSGCSGTGTCVVTMSAARSVTANFTPVTAVTVSGNAGVAGATLSYTGGSTTSAPNGAYTITVPYDWSGTVTPLKTGYSFTPFSRDYSHVSTDWLNQDFVPHVSVFADVPVAGKEWMQPWIEAFYQHGVTTGCGGGNYCPENNVTRAEMAVFLLRAKHGAGYSPPAASHFFADVPVTGKEWMEPWIDQYYREGMTTGCGGGNYCPENNVTRAEMAVFVLRALHGGGYGPPAASGDFLDVPVAGKEWMEPWIIQFRNEGITSGCGGGNYCPENNVTRAEMAVFVGRAYHFYP